MVQFRMKIIFINQEVKYIREDFFQYKNSFETGKVPEMFFNFTRNIKVLD